MKMRSCAGRVNRVIAVLLALICVMLVLIAIPRLNDYRRRAQKLACDQAMASARDGLIIEYLRTWDAGSAQTAMVTLDEVMHGRDDLCPSGGVVYLARKDNGIFEPVCGLHDSDLKRRVRLNASHALDMLGEALQSRKQAGDAVMLSINGSTLTCVRVGGEEKNLRHGTNATTGYEGTVCFFGVSGEGDFIDSSVEAGQVCYFVYADENYCAIWRADDGWTGDAYQ